MVENSGESYALSLKVCFLDRGLFRGDDGRVIEVMESCNKCLLKPGCKPWKFVGAKEEISGPNGLRVDMWILGQNPRGPGCLLDPDDWEGPYQMYFEALVGRS